MTRKLQYMIYMYTRRVVHNVQSDLTELCRTCEIVGLATTYNYYRYIMLRCGRILKAFSATVPNTPKTVSKQIGVLLSAVYLRVVTGNADDLGRDEISYSQWRRYYQCHRSRIGRTKKRGKWMFETQ